MATNKDITVLTPNGHQANIKISPDTTILQVLEEVCQKHDFNPNEYNLKYFNEILDVNLIFLYSIISNNASLEMVKCEMSRKVSNVMICIQLENGNRLIGEFFPNVNIKKILNDLNIEYNTESAVIIYTHKKLISKEFETVTLRSLGLGSGKALFRLFERDPEKLQEQAHVHVPSKVYKQNKALKVNNKQIKKIESEVRTQDFSSNCKKQIKEKKILIDVNQNNDLKTHQTINEDIEEPQVQFLGNRNALLFNQEDSKNMDQDDIPDDFFKLTVNDAKVLLRDMKKTRSFLEDAPLLTSAQRELEIDKAKLISLHNYKQTIIRIHFPNHLVLQGLFGPLETVQSIKDFIKPYLEHPENDFVLYTSPPRCDLIVNKRLFDQNLVPTAIIYYSGSSGLTLKAQSKLMDPTIANVQALKTRLTTRRKDVIVEDKFIDSAEATMSTSTSLIL